MKQGSGNIVTIASLQRRNSFRKVKIQWTSSTPLEPCVRAVCDIPVQRLLSLEKILRNSSRLTVGILQFDVNNQANYTDRPTAACRGS
jgi:hypothetical protein